MEKFVVFSILLRTRMVPSEVSFIIISFSVIYASLLFAVHFVVTFEKQANISVFESGYSRSYFNLFLIHAVTYNTQKSKTNLHKYVNSAKLIVQKIDLIQKYWANFLNFQIKTYRWSFFIT